MKQKKLTKCLLFTLFFMVAHSQNSSKVGITNEELSWACIQYKKIMQTDSYVKSEEKSEELAEKLGDIFDSNNLPIDSIKDQKLYIKFIERNIKKTKFKSVEEIKIVVEEQNASVEKLVSENKKLYELIDKATPDQRYKIFQPKFDASRKEIFGY